MAFSKRRLLLGAGAFLLLLLVVLGAARIYLVGLAIGRGLEAIGASEVKFNVTQASLVRLVVEDVGFKVRAQSFAAGRVSLARAQWWKPTLGSLRVERGVVPVNVAALAAKTPGQKNTGDRPQKIPFEEISIDGQLVIQAADLPDHALVVKIEARPTAQNSWNGTAQVVGPGLSLKAEAQYEQKSGHLAFQVPEMALDLKPWAGFARHLASLPGDDWELEGKFTGSAEGRFAAGQFTGIGKLQLREGRGVSAAKAIAAEGIEAELEFIDLAQVVTKPGALRIRELRTGQLTLRDLRWEFAFAGSDQIAVSHVSLLTLGGRLSAEPFHLVPSRAELDAVLLVEDISVEEVMALTKDLPAKATGRVNGRVPLHIDAAGFRFGTGWLALKPGAPAEIQFNAKGLLTGGSAPNSASYAVLQKVESGLLKLKINELRLDIRPTNAPEGRSAQLHLTGEPVDKEVKAPVTLDLNVNGPLESLLNMGLNSQLSFGTKP
jgi:hypothetical protein